MVNISSRYGLLACAAVLCFVSHSVVAVPKSRFVRDFDEKKLEEVSACCRAQNDFSHIIVSPRVANESSYSCQVYVAINSAPIIKTSLFVVLSFCYCAGMG